MSLCERGKFQHSASIGWPTPNPTSLPRRLSNALRSGASQEYMYITAHGVFLVRPARPIATSVALAQFQSGSRNRLV